MTLLRSQQQQHFSWGLGWCLGAEQLRHSTNGALACCCRATTVCISSASLSLLTTAATASALLQLIIAA
jgi:hypothetical protein